MAKRWSALLLLFVLTPLLSEGRFMDANPDPENRMLERYELAESMLSWNLTNKVFRNNIQLYQIDETRFWYRVNEREQNRYYLVEDRKSTRLNSSHVAI